MRKPGWAPGRKGERLPVKARTSAEGPGTHKDIVSRKANRIQRFFVVCEVPRKVDGRCVTGHSARATSFLASSRKRVLSKWPGAKAERGLPKSTRKRVLSKRPVAQAERGLKGEGRAAALLLAPSLAGLAVFFLAPFADTVRRSFFDTRGAVPIGGAGYASVVQNSAFRLAVANTARFIGVCLPLLLAASLVLALLVRGLSAARGACGAGSAGAGGAASAKLFRASFLLPMAVPVASIVLLWQVLFHQKGLANSFLSAIGAQTVDFMGTGAVFWVLVFTYIWKNAGYNMVLWLAGLDGIAQSQYEAARVDGAGAWQCFWHITLPSLLPTVGLVAILSLLNSFKVFREAYLVAGPYPHESIYMLQHLFNNWFQNLDISRLCAAAVLLCAALLGIILLLNRLLASRTE